MDLSVCIVNWNTKNLLRNCLKSIYDKTHEIDFEVIVVDNASEDGSVEMLESQFPQCIVIASRVNLGFSKGNNLAIKQARGRYILFLNPDTELKTNNALKGMLNFLEENPRYGAVGCKLLNDDNSIQFTCARKFPTPFGQFCFLSMLDRLFPKSDFFSSSEMTYWDHGNSCDVDCLSGACIMARKTIIDQIHGFNEDYFMYAEDIEICFSIKKNGWLVYYLADEEIYHYSGASSSQVKDKSFSAVLQRDSNYKFMGKNYNKSKAMEYRVFVLFGAFIRVIIISILLPVTLLQKRYLQDLSIYSLKKYFHLILWALNVSPITFSKN